MQQLNSRIFRHGKQVYIELLCEEIEIWYILSSLLITKVSKTSHRMVLALFQII